MGGNPFDLWSHQTKWATNGHGFHGFHAFHGLKCQMTSDHGGAESPGLVVVERHSQLREGWPAAWCWQGAGALNYGDGLRHVETYDLPCFTYILWDKQP